MWTLPFPLKMSLTFSWVNSLDYIENFSAAILPQYPLNFHNTRHLNIDFPSVSSLLPKIIRLLKNVPAFFYLLFLFSRCFHSLCFLPLNYHLISSKSLFSKPEVLLTLHSSEPLQSLLVMPLIWYFAYTACYCC